MADFEMLDLSGRKPISGASADIWGDMINDYVEDSTTQPTIVGKINELGVIVNTINGVSTGLNSKLDKDGYTGTAQDLKDEIDLKAPISNATFTGSIALPTTTSIGNVSSTEISYLDGVTSNIQAQITACTGAVKYIGSWNASTNTPTLTSTPTEKGIYYIVSTGGTQFGITFNAKDWIVSNGTEWQKVDNYITAEEIGLGNVDNTSDFTKMTVSTFTDLDTTDKTIVGAINEIKTELSDGGLVKVYNTVAEMQADNANITEGMTIQLLGYYQKNDGAGHFRKIETSDDGSGLLVGSLFANIIHAGFVDGVWFGITTTDMTNLQNSLNYCSDNKVNFKLKKNTYTLSRSLLPINFDPRRIHIDFCQSYIKITDQLISGDIIFNLNLTSTWDISYGNTGSFKNLTFRATTATSSISDVMSFMILNSDSSTKNIQGVKFENLNTRIYGNNSVFVDIRNNMYLFDFINCQSPNRVLMTSGYSNYGENVSFYKCIFANSYATSNVEINNANGTFNFYTCSFDYSDKFIYNYGGVCNFITCRFETESTGASGTDTSTSPWFEIGNSSLVSTKYCLCNFENCNFVGAYNATATRETIFKCNSVSGVTVDTNSNLRISNSRFFGLKNTSGYMILDANKNTNIKLIGNTGNYLSQNCSYVANEEVNNFFTFSPLQSYELEAMTFSSYSYSTRVAIFNKTATSTNRVRIFIPTNNNVLGDFEITVTTAGGTVTWYLAENLGNIISGTDTSGSFTITKGLNTYLNINGSYLILGFNTTNMTNGNLTLTFKQLHFI